MTVRKASISRVSALAMSASVQGRKPSSLGSNLQGETSGGTASLAYIRYNRAISIRRHDNKRLTRKLVARAPGHNSRGQLLVAVHAGRLKDGA